MFTMFSGLIDGQTDYRMPSAPFFNGDGGIKIDYLLVTNVVADTVTSRIQLPQHLCRTSL